MGCWPGGCSTRACTNWTSQESVLVPPRCRQLVFVRRVSQQKSHFRRVQKKSRGLATRDFPSLKPSRRGGPAHGRRRGRGVRGRGTGAARHRGLHMDSRGTEDAWSVDLASCRRQDLYPASGPAPAPHAARPLDATTQQAPRHKKRVRWVVRASLQGPRAGRAGPAQGRGRTSS